MHSFLLKHKYALSRYFIQVHEKWELRNGICRNR